MAPELINHLKPAPAHWLRRARRTLIGCGLALACLPAFVDCARPRVPAFDPDITRSNGAVLYRGAPFSGVLIELDVVSGVRSESEYDSGKLDGMRREFYADGALASERSFRSGGKVGVHRGWFPDGRLRFLYEFESDRHHGRFVEWHPGGRIARYARYQHGAELGARIWRADGKIYANYIYTPERKIGLTGGRLCDPVRGDAAGRTIDYKGAPTRADL